MCILHAHVLNMVFMTRAERALNRREGMGRGNEAVRTM